MLSPAEYPPASMKLVQDNSPSMADLRMEDDMSHQQTEKDGLAVARSAKSLTPVEEPTKARGKAMHHVPRCLGSSLFAANLEAAENVQEDGVAHQLDDLAVPLHSQLDLGLLPSILALSESLKKSKKGPESRTKTEGKALRFNEDDAIAVSGELVSDSQFLNRNHVICAGNELSSEASLDLQLEQI
ncbi:hypothetical protein Ancab_013243 [Ancistrocladus abbreviatus]